MPRTLGRSLQASWVPASATPGQMAWAAASVPQWERCVEKGWPTMTSMLVEPQFVAGAAADVANIGSQIGEARAAAAGSTTGLVAAAEDEVSAATASLFGAYGQQYQTLLHQAGAFHDQFVAALGAAGNAYSQAEAE